MTGWSIWVAAGLLSVAGVAGAAERRQAPNGAKPLAYTAEHVRDPMKSLLPAPELRQPAVQASVTPRPAPAAQPPALTSLEGIVWGPHAREAIIDGQVYGVGDAVGGGTILSIDRAGVTIQMPGARFLVRGTRQIDQLEMSEEVE